MPRQTLLLVGTAIAVLAVACGKSKGGEQGDPRCDDAIVPFQGYSTDEACKTMLDAEDAGQVVVGGLNAPAITSPTNGTAIAASATSLDIRWSSPLDLDGDAFLILPPAAAAPRPFWARLLRDLAWMPIAEAHLPPMTGALHMIKIFGLPGNTTPYYLAFTTRLHFLLTNTEMTHVVAVTGTSMRIQITDAYLTENRIAQPSTDGPFRDANDVYFHVQ